MTTSPRQPSLAGRLARLGFVDPPRAQRLLADPALAGLLDPLEDVFDDGVLSALGEVPDPDLALLGLVRLFEGLRGRRRRDGTAGAAGLLACLRSGGPARDRLLHVLAGSVALADHLAHHPEHWTVLDGRARTPASAPPPCGPNCCAAVGADPAAERTGRRRCRPGRLRRTAGRLPPPAARRSPVAT